MCTLRTAGAFLLATFAATADAARMTVEEKVKNGVLASSGAIVSPEEVTTVTEGEEGTTSFRRFFTTATGERISPWHDIPMHTSDDTPFEKWMVVEIPKMTKAKFEIHTKERLNPMAQDTKKGKLRDYHGPIYWNYGFLPQTWEDPTVEHPRIGAYGDNDPLDVVEIGSRQHTQGEVTRVRILGALAMIDDGELDWKLIALDTTDPIAATVHNLDELEMTHPYVVSGIREWFRWYKSPDDQLNHFAFDGHSVSQQTALEVIEETHEAWKRLVDGEVQQAEELGLWLA